MNQKGISLIVIILIIVGVLVIGGVVWVYLGKTIVNKPIINVISPSEGEIWKNGETRIIKWSSPANIKSVSISLRECWQEKNVSKVPIAENIKNINEYTWVVSVTPVVTQGCFQIFVYYAGAYGLSKPFQIITEVKGETANWKIYQNSKYGFEMKYPNDWLIEGNQDNVYFKRTDISQEEMEGKQIGYPLSILIEDTSVESILDWFENEFSDRSQDLKPEKQSMTIGGLNAINYSDPISMGGCDKTFAAIKNGKLFRFLKHGSTCNYSDELFTNIISTFKFVK